MQPAAPDAGAGGPTPPAAPATVIHEGAGGPVRTITLTGDLTLAQAGDLDRRLGALAADAPLVMDLAGIGRLDTAGAWALARLAARLEVRGHALTLTGLSPAQAEFVQAIRTALPPAPVPPRPPSLTDRLEALGRGTVAGAALIVDLVGMLGLWLVRLGNALMRPATFPLTSVVHHCQQVGLNAVPIVALMAFLIGIVVAFQGATQLRQFGAEVFVVDLIAISILRELGILLTAVIVAGRTASAFTAAIGAMKMREEIDAMRTLSIDPGLALIVPRVLALLIMLPVLGLIANLAGLIGGALMSWAELGISPAMFRTRLIEETAFDHVLVGMIKAPVFALLIGLIGCHAGMQVKGDTESLGRMTSAAVVRALFAVILADALFSVFFAKIGI